MAEAVIGSTIEVLLQPLIALSAEEIRLFKNFSKDLQKLKDSAAIIRDFLEDAEMKVVTTWLGKLEVVAYDADYLFDELNYLVLLKEVHRGSKMKKKFGLQRRIESVPARGVGADGLANRETDSVNTDCVFVGREDDATKIVEMVKKCPTNDKLSVIPIVGMGGWGKTTLVKKVFYHVNIKYHFENYILVYVFENFVEETVFKSVYESLTGKKIDGSREVVLRELRGEIGDKRYLLVPDDVWNEDAEKWDDLITTLEANSPSRGNVVVLTTRNDNVASIVKTNYYIHKLGFLSLEDCWSIIKDYAKKDCVSSEVEIIGRKILEKCGGLSLAAKVAGGLLRGK